MDWLGKKCRKYLERLFPNLCTMMPVIWSSIAASGSCQGMFLNSILRSRFVMLIPNWFLDILLLLYPSIGSDRLVCYDRHHAVANAYLYFSLYLFLLFNHDYTSLINTHVKNPIILIARSVWPNNFSINCYNDSVGVVFCPIDYCFIKTWSVCLLSKIKSIVLVLKLLEYNFLEFFDGSIEVLSMDIMEA